MALDGALVDEAGKELGRLAPDEARIPAGQRRTLALVYAGVEPKARRAEVWARSAEVVTWSEQAAPGYRRPIR